MPTLKNGRMPRGSNPPHLRMSEAFSLAGLIWEHGGGQCSFDMLSRLTNNSTGSSSFIKKVNALKTYSLITEIDKSSVTLTELGRDLVAPTSPMVQAQAKKASFLTMEVFSKIYERHKGKLLPADEFLANIVEQDCGIPRDLVTQWLIYFKDAANAAGLLFQRPDGKTQINEIPNIGPKQPIVTAESAPPPDVVRPIPQDERRGQPLADSISGQTCKIELSGKRYATFSIPDSLTARDASKLKGALSGLSAIIDSMLVDAE